MRTLAAVLIVAAIAAPIAGQPRPGARPPRAAPKVPAKVVQKDHWVQPMKAVHAKFTGEKGTFAHFGDSITVSLAFWASMKWSQKNMDVKTQAAFDLVKGYMKDDCWHKWKGNQYGNEGGMTIRWAHGNVDKWLKALNPEVALIMFGTNDLGPLKVDEYQAKTRQVVQKCLDNGTVVILSTIPPRHGADAKVKRFVEAVRKVARDMKVPLSDYYQACMDRRPEDWSGGHAKFKSVPGGTYEVPTLISRDGVHPSNPQKWQGDYSAEGLKHNGFVLRNYVVLHSYADVIRKALSKPTPTTGTARRASKGARADLAKIHLSNVQVALDRYRMDMGRYPSAEEGLKALLARPAFEDEALASRWRGPYLKRSPEDPWGREYVYRRKNEGGCELFSLGPDGKEGTQDDVKPQ